MRIPVKVISGGQTGADQGGLLGAKALGIPTGGWAPRGYMTERGPQGWLKHMYGLKETDAPNYRPRTTLNIMESGGTVLWGKLESAGSRLTIEICRRAGKPWLTNPTAEELRAWFDGMAFDVLNVAGNRASVNPGLENYVAWVMRCAWGEPPSYTPPVPVLKG